MIEISSDNAIGLELPKHEEKGKKAQWVISKDITSTNQPQPRFKIRRSNIYNSASLHLPRQPRYLRQMVIKKLLLLQP